MAIRRKRRFVFAALLQMPFWIVGHAWTGREKRAGRRTGITLKQSMTLMARGQTQPSWESRAFKIIQNENGPVLVRR